MPIDQITLINDIVSVFYSEEKPSAEEFAVIKEHLLKVFDKYFKQEPVKDIDQNAVVSAMKTTKSNSKKTPGPKKGSVNKFTIFLADECDWEQYKKEQKEANADATVSYADFQKAMKARWEEAKSDPEMVAQLEHRANEFQEWKIEHPSGKYAEYRKQVPLN